MVKRDKDQEKTMEIINNIEVSGDQPAHVEEPKNHYLILESVRERDIDLLLLEEWNVNGEFATWFVSKIQGMEANMNHRYGYHSVAADNLGETDLFLEYDDDRGKVAILVENKIDACFQKNQARRYKRRASNIEEKGYSKAITCIVAPRHFLDAHAESREFDSQISYEDIGTWFRSQDNERARYRSTMIRLAIHQERRGYSPQADPSVTRFWHDYWETLQSEIPEAYMREPAGIPEGSDWPIISFEWMKPRWSLKHKLSRGAIDLETDIPEKALKQCIARINEPHVVFARTGKSNALRIKVDCMDRHLSFHEQYEKMKMALRALRDLDTWGNEGYLNNP